MRQELATLLMSVQLLKEENLGRKIAEIQGQLATVSLGPQEATRVCLLPRTPGPQCCCAGGYIWTSAVPICS